MEKKIGNKKGKWVFKNEHKRALNFLLAMKEPMYVSDGKNIYVCKKIKNVIVNIEIDGDFELFKNDERSEQQ